MIGLNCSRDVSAVSQTVQDPHLLRRVKEGKLRVVGEVKKKSISSSMSGRNRRRGGGGGGGGAGPE